MRFDLFLLKTSKSLCQAVKWWSYFKWKQEK